MNGSILEADENIQIDSNTQKDSNIGNFSDSESEPDHENTFNILDCISFKHNQFSANPTRTSQETLFDQSGLNSMTDNLQNNCIAQTKNKTEAKRQDGAKLNKF